MKINVNGVDMIPYLAPQGFQVEYFSREGQNSGVNMDGKDHTEILADKVRIKLIYRGMTSTEISTVLQAVKPRLVTVVYTDAEDNAEMSKTMKKSSRGAQYLTKKKDGREIWGGLSITLEEQ